MKNKRIHALTIDAMLIAIIAIMTFIPQFGFIMINAGLSLTLIPLPVLIGAYLGGIKRGGIYGFTFGVMSFLKALTAPGNDALFFSNPLVAIVPRVLFGLLAGLFFHLLLKRSRPKKTSITLVAVISLTTTLLHGVMTLSFAGIFFPQVWPMLLMILLTNTLIEATVMALLVPIIISSLQVIFLKENLYHVFHKKPQTSNEMSNEK
ncbi:MAG: ECF transporter S component [Bacilli bacterium]|jgi:uncharacterized membrane protein